MKKSLTAVKLRGISSLCSRPYAAKQRLTGSDFFICVFIFIAVIVIKAVVVVIKAVSACTARAGSNTAGHKCKFSNDFFTFGFCIYFFHDS